MTLAGVAVALGVTLHEGKAQTAPPGKEAATPELPAGVSETLWCIENPLRGKPLADDDERLRALEAYIYAQRRGVPLEYGKH